MEKASWRVSRWKDSFRRLGSSDTSSSCPRHSPPQERDYPDADPRGGLMTELPDRATAYPMTASTAARCTCNDKRNARKYRFKLIGGLLLPYFLASLDLTVVSTALPFIASDFSTLHLLLISSVISSTPSRLSGDFLGCTFETNRAGRPVRPAQLDRHGLHPHFDRLHTRFWPAGRRVWPLHLPAGCFVLHRTR